MRRGRVQFIKLGVAAIIVLAVFYFLFSGSKVHHRAKQVISARFQANKPRNRPVHVKGNKMLVQWSKCLIFLIKCITFQTDLDSFSFFLFRTR